MGPCSCDWSIGENCPDCHPGKPRTVEEERADVVAWLRWRNADRSADGIERGEHVGFASKEKP